MNNSMSMEKKVQRVAELVTRIRDTEIWLRSEHCDGLEKQAVQATLDNLTYELNDLKRQISQ